MIFQDISFARIHALRLNSVLMELKLIKKFPINRIKYFSGIWYDIL